MAKIKAVLSAWKLFKDQFDLSDSMERMDALRGFATKFSPKDIKDAAKKASGPDKGMLNRAASEAEDFKKYMADVEFNKGGTTRGASLEQYASSLPKNLSPEERKKAIEGYKEYLDNLQKAGGPKRKGGPIQKKPKMKHGGMMKPKMMGGGMYGKKMHSYVAGGNVKDMKIMKSK